MNLIERLKNMISDIGFGFTCIGIIILFCFVEIVKIYV